MTFETATLRSFNAAAPKTFPWIYDFVLLIGQGRVYYCCMGHTTVYKDYAEPIKLMKVHTSEGIPFKLEFRKKNGERRLIANALLRKQSLGEHDSKSQYKIQYYDLDNESPGSCYIPLILAVNDKKIIL